MTLSNIMFFVRLYHVASVIVRNTAKKIRRGECSSALTLSLSLRPIQGCRRVEHVLLCGKYLQIQIDKTDLHEIYVIKS